ncbi:MAG TPA: hypothetical protein VFF06_27670 [Polyangia bacterium]|nr:hypothetical protein [Polyangia bacterium]
MLYRILPALLLAACTADNPLYVGDGDGGAGGGGDAAQADGARHDQAACAPSCSDDLAGARDLAAAPPSDLAQAPADLGQHQCTPTCNGCFGGGACCPGAPHGGCCASGEWCDNGTCRCGDGPACTNNGDRCAQGGIIQFGSCGSLCCGGFNDPCPL